MGLRVGQHVVVDVPVPVAEKPEPTSGERQVVSPAPLEDVPALPATASRFAGGNNRYAALRC